MNATSLDQRIRAIRQSVRARQPLQHRIDTIRQQRDVLRKRRQRNMRFDLGGS